VICSPWEGSTTRLGLHRFGGVFRTFAHERQEPGDPWLLRITLGAAIVLASPELADRIAVAPEPFWRHVRDALRAHRESVSVQG
jgi:hypothetical protein